MKRRTAQKLSSGISPATLLLLAALFVLIAVMRLRTYHEPPNRDLAVYSVIARELLAEKRLYADLWDNKLPALGTTICALLQEKRPA